MVRAELEGRDFIEQSSSGEKVQWVGCSEFNHAVELLLKGSLDPKKWPLPKGNDHCSMLIREFVLKCRGEWQIPVEDTEICHCRTVPTAVVDQAIVSGAHSPKIVSQWTTASTACGTCRPDVEKLIAYRLGRGPQTDSR